MAARNSIKVLQAGTFYHIYNRGVEKRRIFLDKQDFSVFLSYLKTYLEPKDEEGLLLIANSLDSSWREKDRANKELKLKNYFSDLELVCFALMPNHFHLLIKLINTNLNSFMNSLGTRYGMYFNKKYKRSGVLFQDAYKAVPVYSNEQLLHLSRYIHLNPKDKKYPTSLSDFLGQRNTTWVKKDYILNYFMQKNSQIGYRDFIGEPRDDSFIGKLMLDDE